MTSPSTAGSPPDAAEEIRPSSTVRYTDPTADAIPRQACQRELKEELGINQTPGRLLLSAYVHTADGAHIYWVFDGGMLTTEQQQAIVLQESELTAFRFSAPEEISPDEIPPSRRSLWDAALGALTDGSTVHLEVVG